jgi:hypothetical protein
MRDFRDAKGMAQSLREALAAKQISISHGEALELVSRMLGAADWNVLSALIKNDPTDHAGRSADEDRNRRAWRLAEQQTSRTVVPFDPVHFDKYVGSYESRPGVVVAVTRDGGRFYSAFPHQAQPTEFYPESDTKFFATTVAAQISFVMDSKGSVTELVVHQNGREQRAKRIDAAAAERVAAALKRRIAANTPSPGTEEAVRRHLETMARGEPDFDVLVPELAETARQQFGPAMRSAHMGLGPLKAIKFVRVTESGYDEYEAQFEHGARYWTISPLGPDGRAYGMSGRSPEQRAARRTG